jgi:hypothetical protein
MAWYLVRKYKAAGMNSKRVISLGTLFDYRLYITNCDK